MAAKTLDDATLVEPYGSTYRTKWLSENLAPLRRWLGQQVGRPWDKVYSELSENLSPSNAVKQHVRDHVDDFVEVKVVENDGVVCTPDGRPVGLYRRRRHALYVCPRSGILKQLGPDRKMAHDARPLAAGRWLVRRGGSFVYVVTEKLRYEVPVNGRTCAFTKLVVGSRAYRYRQHAGAIPWGWEWLAIEAYVPGKKLLRDLLREAERIAIVARQRP